MNADEFAEVFTVVYEHELQKMRENGATIGLKNVTIGLVVPSFWQLNIITEDRLHHLNDLVFHVDNEEVVKHTHVLERKAFRSCKLFENQEPESQTLNVRISIGYGFNEWANERYEFYRVEEWKYA